MPALHALGRRWYIAADDLFLPSLLGVCTRTAWIVILGTCFTNYLSSSSHKECSHPNIVLMYLATATALISLVLCIEVMILLVSMRGGVMQTEKRRSMPTLLHFRLVLFLVEIALCVFGTYWNFVESGCSREVLIPIRLVVASNWVLVALTIVGLIVVFDPFGGYHSDKSINDKLWEKRFKSCWCCCIGYTNNNHGAFEDIARILSSMFEDIDLVASDVAVGLMIVNQQQNYASYKRNYINECTYDNLCTLYNFSDPVDRQVFQDLSYFSFYAIGAYGWPLFVYIHPVTGCFNLCQECSILEEQGTSTDNVLRGTTDNVCHSNHIALKKLSGLEDHDILYTKFSSSIYSPAFYIAVDHDKQVVIVSVRGTLSLQDVITDMVCETQEIPGYTDYLAHRGIVLSAQNILQIIHSDRLLDRAFERYPDFSLLVTGHSLGAGTATLLAFLLRPTYPTLRCYSYGPPGCLLSENAMEESREFVVSTVINKEFSVRLSIKSLNELRDNVLTAIRTNQRPKWKLTADHLTVMLGLKRDLLLNSDEEAPLIVPTFGNAVEEEEEQLRLYPPGKVIFLHRTDSESRCCTSNKGTWEVLSAPNTIFDDIDVSPEMLSDHLPDTLVTLLRDLQPLENTTPGSCV